MIVEDEGFVHKLVISNPTLADMGKYTCDVNGIITEAYLEVEGTSRFIIRTTGFVEQNETLILKERHDDKKVLPIFTSFANFALERLAGESNGTFRKSNIQLENQTFNSKIAKMAVFGSVRFAANQICIFFGNLIKIIRRTF